jgi:glucosamine--fructose-6-phosphate aminotransferase (isomerizing)
MLATISKLQGNYSFAAIFPNGTLAAARFHEPLIVGIGKHGYFVASDILGFVEQTDKAIYIDNLEMVIIDESGIAVSDFTGAPVKHEVTRVSNEIADAEKGDYVHYTLKEIFDQPTTILKAGRRVESDIARAADIIKRAKNVYITGSGSSFHAGLVGKYLLSKFGGISVEPIIASEARFYPVRFTDQSVVIAMSQSGESADVLESVSLAKDNGATIISLVNVMSSSLAHLSEVSIGLNCGPEIGVAATKSFTAQLAVLYKIADEVCGGCIAPDFEKISDAISTVLANHQKMKEMVENFTGVSDIYVLGMGIHYSLAAEASLKLKELAYVHAEALPGGELKHGPLALLDPQAHVIIMNPADSTYQNVIAGAHEVKARGAKVIGISDVPNDLYDYWIQIPSVEKVMYPLVEIIPAQLLSYYLALHNNANPDYPRNLAKSVTVK